ncbi:CynX/NimT family MFS transporter [Sulfoacidibacillus thermotolerans]|uniref:Major facilitator superfamily (MFS) profile domain-containing protein n=1 Tax=Sulfoacidibacillus thermotolerans TaxID=1765684 RepID=A0A2U3D9X5_SULT2|nr:MFS transporter [Sulfoacidibacillus thermotolerans]PWI58087.1 hypothetical protein BM613_05320 [Sulfoacidibacillus thermotolerans]
MESRFEAREVSPGLFTAAYVGFAFSVGAAWFVLAPMVPQLIRQLHTSLGSVLLFLSLYGFAMIVFSLPAAWWARKDGIAPVLRTAIVLSFIGLFGRIFAFSYDWFFVAQAIAAVAYPLLISPIGAVILQVQIKHIKTVTGLAIGMLFLGMAAGSYVGPTLLQNFGFTGALAIVSAVNLVAGVFLFIALNHLPHKEQRQVDEQRIVFGSPRWWWVGFAIASTSVMFGGIAVSVLLHLHIPDAVKLGGTLTALTFIGSGIGAIGFPLLADFFGHSGIWQSVLMGLTTLFSLFVVLEFTGGFVVSVSTLQWIFLLLGFFGNGCYALALGATAEMAREIHKAGVQTAGFSMASNVGVALLPPLVGPLVITFPAGFGVITLAILILATGNVVLNARRT